MERITRTRVGILVLIFCLVIGSFSFMLYDMQIISTGGSTNNVTTFETLTRVKAARGNILDSKGNVLVTNRASYDLVINHYVLTSSATPNKTLYDLVQLCRSHEITYTDHLPISAQPPFEYTLSDYNSTWQNYFQTFLAYRDNLDSDITAPLLMKKLRDSYAIPDDWSDEDARAVLGLRYELSLRNCVGSLSNYVFLSDVDTDTLAAVLELNVPGMNVETSTVRQYNTKYAAHILGYIGAMSATQWEQYKDVEGYSMDALIGQDGLEKAFEQYLHGTDGTRVDVVTKDGTLVKSYYLEEPKAGQNVQISIDLNLQAAAEDALAITMESLRDPTVNLEGDGLDAAGAAVVALDIKSGQVLVCGSYPTYDLSTLFENYNDLMEADFQPMFNRALQAEYPPGSTYKMSMTIAGIDNHAITPTERIYDAGKYLKYEGFSASCLYYTDYGMSHGTIDCTDALKYSCNYFFYELADRLKIDAIDATAKGLGLGEKTGVELYERLGHRANPDTKAALHTGDDARWYTGDRILTGIGQSENRFTPMQLCSYVSTIINRGTRYKATFLNRVVSSDYHEVVFENTPEVMNKIFISDSAVNAVMTGMEKVANDAGGTARKIFANYPIKVAAKTGTAQTGDKRYSDNGAFVCYAPADDPQIAVVVYGERAGHGRSMGDVAKAILDAYFGVDSSGSTLPGENEIS
jgi:penicillin-binding protein 2